jgi:hypothetical protein
MSTAKGDWDIIDLAHKYTIDILEKHGNVVSQIQNDALREIQANFVMTIAHPEQKRRVAFPLPCGAGKTTAVRGLCRAINEADKPYNIAICAEKVEALCDLKRMLINDGVPEDKISLLHSYKHDSNYNFAKPIHNTASEPSTSSKEIRQFVLFSHEKLQKGFRPSHDLLIYDESLILGKGADVRLDDTIGTMGYFMSCVKAKQQSASPHQKDLSKWLTKVEKIILDAENDDLLVFPKLPMAIAEAKAADIGVHGESRDTLRRFMMLVHEGYEMRVMKGLSQGDAIISVRQTIADDLNSIVILDASYNIRKLMAFDDTVTASLCPANIKDHSDVTVHLCRAKSGRSGIMEGLRNNKDLDLFYAAVDTIAQLLLQGRRVLCFTFKDDNGIRPVDELKRLIKEKLNGLDPDMLSTGGTLEFITWGHETAINKYSHCDAIVFAGLLTLPTASVAAKVFAHSRDITTPLTNAELSEVVHSEKVHSLYQGLSRGRCRVMIDGKALPMDAYVFSNDINKLKEALGTVMYGVQFKTFKSKHINYEITKTEQFKEQALEILAVTEGPVSIRVLNNSVEVEACKEIKKTGLDELLADELCFDWVKVDRSLQRLSC